MNAGNHPEPRADQINQANADAAAAIAAAKADEKIAPALEGMATVKELYVPGKLVNLVVRPR